VHAVPLELSEQNDQELVLAFLAESGDEFTSGEALCGKLGLSRAAVFKSVESLRLQGYRIEAVPARGYRLVRVPDRLSALELSPLLGTHDVGRSLEYHASLPSTHLAAFQAAEAGAPHGHLVIAEEQKAGRGRRGRTWVSPAGLNLYASLVLRPDLPIHRAAELTLLTAVALTEWLREDGVEATIKWPNDVRAEGLKLAGILTELKSEGDRVSFVVVGVGVNLNVLPADLPEDLRDIATSVRLQKGEVVARAPFVAGFLTRLEEWLDLHEEVGFPPVRAAWKELSETLGHPVRVALEGQTLVGVAEDIDESGALVVRNAEGHIHRVLAGDVEQLRGDPPPR
jgi:BirA family biotin operon repressor/biotin-[acetyl-CoA-carboxylase] ligase